MINKFIVYGTDATDKTFSFVETTDQPTRDTAVWTILKSVEDTGGSVDRIYFVFGVYDAAYHTAHTKPPKDATLVYSKNPPYNNRGIDPHFANCENLDAEEIQKRIAAYKERTDKLLGLIGNGPDVVYIKRNDGGGWDVCEHRYNPRRETYKRFAVAELSDYICSGADAVIIIDDFQDQEDSD